MRPPSGQERQPEQTGSNPRRLNSRAWRIVVSGSALATPALRRTATTFATTTGRRAARPQHPAKPARQSYSRRFVDRDPPVSPKEGLRAPSVERPRKNHDLRRARSRCSDRRDRARRAHGMLWFHRPTGCSKRPLAYCSRRIHPDRAGHWGRDRKQFVPKGPRSV